MAAAGLTCGWVLWRRYFQTKAGNRIHAASALFILCGALVTLLAILRSPWGYRWMLASGLAFAWSMSLCGAWAISTAWRALAPRGFDPRRRHLLLLAAPPAVMAFAILRGRRDFQLVETEISIPGLHPDLNGLRLAQLSDIHLSAFLSRAELARCVDMANSTRPHVALVTGDLITGIADSVTDCLDELQRLRADAGVLGCMGNHEAYIRGESMVEAEALRRGMRFLRRAGQSLRFGLASINFTGVDYQPFNRPYLRGVEKFVREGELNVLLSHNPDVFPVAAAQKWDLVIAGHTHGGQLNVEILHQNLNALRAFVTPYVKGLYTRGASSIYVSAGIGTVGVPARIGAPPEVSLLVLRA